MNKKTVVTGLLAVVVLAGAGYGLYAIGMQHGMTMSSSTKAPMAADQQTSQGNAALVDPDTGKKVLYWHDPMVPGHKFDKPGKSPFMDMDLVPVYADAAGDEGGVSISSRVQQNLGIRTAEVTKTSLATTVQAVGSVAYNERNVALVPARSNGFVEKLFVRAPLDPVKRGQPLAELYVPEWVAAQEEYLSIQRMQAAVSKDLLDAARQRMRLAGMTEDQIRRVTSTGRVQPRMVVAAPVGGVVTELAVREGMSVATGAPMFRINGLETVWVHAEVPENMAAQVRPGSTIEARTPSWPEATFKGTVSALLPQVNPTTRTIQARIELANPKQQLVPGMFVNVNFTPSARENVLVVPTEAIIQTGRRNVVIVAQDKGDFIPVEVEIGTEANGQSEILQGLQDGQKVVTSGQFLIDSEASLKGVLGRMNATSQNAPENQEKPAAQTHRGEGKVENISKEEITLSHGPIPSLKWGAMTMGFKLPPGVLLKNVAVGDAVTFEVRAMDDGTYQIAGIAKKGTAQASGSATPPPMHEGHAQ